MLHTTPTPNASSNRNNHALLRPDVHAWAMERPLVMGAGLTRGMTVVDLGCGDGTFTRFLAGEVGTEGEVIALDVDSERIAACEKGDNGRASKRVSWRAASAYDTGLDDNSVDFVFARHLFQHLTDPARALAEAHRILKPGGTICLLDTHDGLLWLQPAPEGHDAFMARAAEQQRLRGGDREIGRKLSGLLADADFADVWNDVHVYDTGRLPAELFMHIAIEPLRAVFPGDDAADADAHLKACQMSLLYGESHGSAGFYATHAKKP